MENIHKIWGDRRRIHLDDRNEVDLLYINKDAFCSTHYHKNKINKFTVITGTIIIESEYGTTILSRNDSWVVRPPMKHRFLALEDSVMIEIGYVEEGIVDPNDIIRESQGGKIIDGVEKTLEELKKEGLLDL